MALTVMPVTAKKEHGAFDLFEAVMAAVKSRTSLRAGDILVVSSKYVSNSQGRLIAPDRVSASRQGELLAKKHRMSPEIAEVVLREADLVFGGMAGFVMASRDGIMAPNAGIDRSNARDGAVILYPDNPYQSAEQLKRKIFLSERVHVGVIIADSRLMPARAGTTGVAVSCAGMEPVIDMRARADLNGNPLKVTFQATADNLASIANHEMGEGAESRPIAVIRDSGVRMTDRRINPDETAVSHDQCVYVRSLGPS